MTGVSRIRGRPGAGRTVGPCLIILGLLPASSPAAPDRPDPDSIMARATEAVYYPGDDMRARIRMEIEERDGTTRYRVMTQLRVDLPDGEQKYLLYFHEPGDVRRMTCMVEKHVGRDDDRWIFVPLVDRVRKISAPERSRFLGSDFVREEFSGRDAAADSHSVVREEKRGGRVCWVIESRPRGRAEYERSLSWIDRATYLPLRQEFYGPRGNVMRVFEAAGIRTIRGAGGARYPFPFKRSMADGNGDHVTRLLYEEVKLDMGLRASDLSEAHMRVPLDEWLPGAMGR